MDKLLKDEKRLRQLLDLEKKRRGKSENSLVFVGMANVAKHWWCTQQAVLNSRKKEMLFFATYLSDRINQAQKMKIIDRLPRSDKALLDVGQEINLTDIDKAFEEKQEKNSNARMSISAIQIGKVIYINPDDTVTEMIEDDVQLDQGNLEDNPLIRGELLASTRAEKYPTIRWNFSWRDYRVIGVPDGLTKDFVYEFKTTRDRGLLRYIKPIALAQADLYGMFFQRPKKRVQINIVKDNVTETYEDPVDLSNAEKTLAAFERVDRGERALPPKPWKCSRCDYRTSCPISQA